jgi:hypothetical protein
MSLRKQPIDNLYTNHVFWSLWYGAVSKNSLLSVFTKNSKFFSFVQSVFLW